MYETVWSFEFPVVNLSRLSLQLHLENSAVMEVGDSPLKGLPVTSEHPMLLSSLYPPKVSPNFEVQFFTAHAGPKRERNEKIDLPELNSPTTLETDQLVGSIDISLELRKTNFTFEWNSWSWFLLWPIWFLWYVLMLHLVFSLNQRVRSFLQASSKEVVNWGWRMHDQIRAPPMFTSLSTAASSGFSSPTTYPTALNLCFSSYPSNASQYYSQISSSSPHHWWLAQPWKDVFLFSLILFNWKYLIPKEVE